MWTSAAPGRSSVTVRGSAIATDSPPRLAMPSGTHSSQESRVLCPPETETLRRRVIAAVQSHLPQVQPAARSPRATPAQVDETARAALDAMLTRPFRVGTLPAADVYGQLLSR